MQNNASPAKIERVYKTVSKAAIKRDALYNLDKIKSLLEKNCHVPAHFQLDVAIGQGDCFFDAVAQGLNQLVGHPNECDVKSLRLLCDSYAKAPQNTWVKEAIIKDHDNYESYLTRIAFTATEMETAGWNVRKDPAIWGRPHIEGRMLCEQFDIKLHVIEVQEDENNHLVSMEQLVDKQTLRSLESLPEADYADRRTLHVVVYHHHFVPLLPSVPGLEHQRPLAHQVNEQAPKIETMILNDQSRAYIRYEHANTIFHAENLYVNSDNNNSNPSYQMNANVNSSLDKSIIGSFLTAIRDHYQNQPKLTCLFTDRQVLLNEIYINLALLDKITQQEKEKSQLHDNQNNNVAKASYETNSNNKTFRDRRLTSYEEIYGNKTSVELHQIFEKSENLLDLTKEEKELLVLCGGLYQQEGSEKFVLSDAYKTTFNQEELGLIDYAYHWNLFVATSLGSYNIVQSILALYPELINYQDKFGKTCLHIAAKHGNNKLCAFLIEHGADVCLPDTEGTRAFDVQGRSNNINSSKKPAHLSVNDEWVRLSNTINLFIPKMKLYENQQALYLIKNEYGLKNLWIYSIHQYEPKYDEQLGGIADIKVLVEFNSSRQPSDLRQIKCNKLGRKIREILTLKNYVKVIPKGEDTELKDSDTLENLCESGKLQKQLLNQVKEMIGSNSLMLAIKQSSDATNHSLLSASQKLALAKLGQLIPYINPLSPSSYHNDTIYALLDDQEKLLLENILIWNQHACAMYNTANALEVMKILIDHNIDLNALDKTYGMSSLQRAYQSKNWPMCVLLLRHGADPHLMVKIRKNPNNLSGLPKNRNNILAMLNEKHEQSVNKMALAQPRNDNENTVSYLYKVHLGGIAKRIYNRTPKLKMTPKSLQQTDSETLKKLAALNKNLSDERPGNKVDYIEIDGEYYEEHNLAPFDIELVPDTNDNVENSYDAQQMHMYSQNGDNTTPVVNKTFLHNFLTAIETYYKNQPKLTCLFTDRQVPLNEIYINLALLDSVSQKEKEKRQLCDNQNNNAVESMEATNLEENNADRKKTFRDRRLSSYEEIYGSKTSIEIRQLFSVLTCRWRNAI